MDKRERKKATATKKAWVISQKKQKNQITKVKKRVNQRDKNKGRQKQKV